jgi:hypothetical protein
MSYITCIPADYTLLLLYFQPGANVNAWGAILVKYDSGACRNVVAVFLGKLEADSSESDS